MNYINYKFYAYQKNLNIKIREEEIPLLDIGYENKSSMRSLCVGQCKQNKENKNERNIDISINSMKDLIYIYIYNKFSNIIIKNVWYIELFSIFLLNLLYLNDLM